jgi:4-amino-4-deoxy-L-arabinose transferase-like glycosyltransferase
MNDRSLIGGSSVFLMIVLILSIMVLSMVPPVAKDELVHHLAVPKLYLKHGGIFEIPSMPFSYYPMNLQLLYLAPLYFGNDIVPKFIHFSFALATAWLIYRYLKRRTLKICAFWGTFFFLSVPIVVKLSITAYIDLGITFFSFASLLSLLRWMEKGFHPRDLIFSGVLCGLALGTKYNGLVVLLLLMLFVPWFYSRFHPHGKFVFFKAAAHAVIFFSVSALVFSPWMIRNYHWKKNPIYPLYDHWIHPQEKKGSFPAQISQESTSPGLGLFVIRERIYQESGWEIALIPLRIFFAGRDGSPRQFDGELNPFLLLFSLLAFFRMKGDRGMAKTEKKAMLSFSLLFFAIAFFTTDLRIRYIAPIVPPLIVLSSLGLNKIVGLVQCTKNERIRIFGLAIIGSAAVFALILNGGYVLRQFRSVQPFGYLAGEVSRDDYVTRYRPEYPAMKYINDHLPPDAVVCLVFLGRRGYYCDRDYVHGEGWLDFAFREADTPEDIHRSLSRSGVTHLLVNDPLFGKWVSDNFSSEKLMNIYSFIEKYTKIEFDMNKYFLLSLEKALS